MASSKQEKARAESERAEAKKTAKDDAELVLQKVKDAGESWRCSEGAATGGGGYLSLLCNVSVARSSHLVETGCKCIKSQCLKL